jgi:transcription termination factor NusB
MKSARRRSRELATQGLYQWLLSGSPGGEIDAQLRGAQGFDKADHEHLDAILHGVIRDSEALSADIARRHSLSRGHQRSSRTRQDVWWRGRLQVRERRAGQTVGATARR